MTKAGTLLTCLVLTLAANVGIARAQNATTASTAQVSSTIYSIGIEWQITGDANHDATAAVRYRPAGTATWKPALPLVRVQNATANTLAGSVLFLSANTTYEITVTLADPDGGGETRTLTASTRPLPVAPAGGRMFHVVPGTSGGDSCVHHCSEARVGRTRRRCSQRQNQPGLHRRWHAGAEGDGGIASHFRYSDRVRL
jgi:hypothetical protein